MNIDQLIQVYLSGKASTKSKKQLNFALDMIFEGVISLLYYTLQNNPSLLPLKKKDMMVLHFKSMTLSKKLWWYNNFLEKITELREC